MLAFFLGARPGDHGKAVVIDLTLKTCTPKKPVHMKTSACVRVYKNANFEESWKFRKKNSLLS